MYTTHNLIESIVESAIRNIDNNFHLIDGIADAAEAAESYLKQYSSVIARDVSMVDDRREMITAFTKQILANAYIFKVLCHYLQEAERQEELEVEDCLEEFLAEMKKSD